MCHYVYILQSLKDKTYYKGYSTDYMKRFRDHNAGKSRYTSNKVPWELVYVEECESKATALIREKYLKKVNREYIEWLISQPSNILLV